MLMPKRTKYRRPHRLSYEGKSKAGTEIAYGEYGLVAMTGAYISNNQIEAARVAMTRYMNRGGSILTSIVLFSSPNTFKQQAISNPIDNNNLIFFIFNLVSFKKSKN